MDDAVSYYLNYTLELSAVFNPFGFALTSLQGLGFHQLDLNRYPQTAFQLSGYCFPQLLQLPYLITEGLF